MSFLYPYLLLLLAVPLALLVWTWRRRGAEVALPFDHGKPGRGLFWYFLLTTCESLPALLLAIAIVLLAGPQRYGEPLEKRKLTNIEICLDISGSMIAEWHGGSRYDGAMNAVNEFVKYRKGDAVGLTFFGNSVLHWCPLTSDISAITCATPFMRPEKVPYWFGGTEIARAVRSCKQVISDRQDGDKIILLVTDGFSSDLHGGAAEEIAKECKKANITVFAIIIGMEQIQEEIHTITTGTGGEAFESADPESLRAIFRKIDQMRQAPMEKKLADTLDNYRPWCIAALVLLGVAGLAFLGIRYTPW